MEKVVVNVWGKQTEVQLGEWKEIKKLGFKKRDRAFGSLNDGTPALFFYKYRLGCYPVNTPYDWHITTEKLEDIND
jgi:hypothetical protein